VSIRCRVTSKHLQLSSRTLQYTTHDSPRSRFASLSTSPIFFQLFLGIPLSTSPLRRLPLPKHSHPVRQYHYSKQFDAHSSPYPLVSNCRNKGSCLIQLRTSTLPLLILHCHLRWLRPHHQYLHHLSLPHPVPSCPRLRTTVIPARLRIPLLLLNSISDPFLPPPLLPLLQNYQKRHHHSQKQKRDGETGCRPR